MTGADDPLVVLVTFPSQGAAAEVCRELVRDRRVACANLVPGIRSLYRWEGRVQDDAETLAILKTTRGALDALERAVVEAHPYDTPEFIALRPEHVEARYLAWLRAGVREGDAGGAA